MCPSIQQPVDMILDLEKMSQQWDHGKISTSKYKAQVQAKSRRLYTSLTLGIATLEGIRDLVRELEQLRVDTE